VYSSSRVDARGDHDNESSYLSVGIPDDGVVIWGKGFEVDRVGRLPWLADAEVL
jgi:hypothetical protein